MYPVNELFTTIQGEAEYTGTPSLFVRMQGCDVGCPWCDTKHTWDLGRNLVNKLDVIGWGLIASDSVRDNDSYAAFSLDELLATIQSANIQHVVFTGGEPCTYDLYLPTQRLIDDGHTVQIETSGTYKILCDERTWVTLSPKFDMPGGLPVRADCVERANEIKLPIGKKKDLDLIDRLKTINPRADHTKGKKIWLQPLSQNSKATQICVNSCLQNGHYLSAQTHKFLNLR